MMLEKFKKIANRSQFAEYYGEFDGRGDHTGYAVTADGQYEYAQFCLKLAAAGLESIAEERPLIDQQGYGQIYSWNQSLFEQ